MTVSAELVGFFFFLKAPKCMVFTSFLTRRDLWFLTFLNCVLCVLGVCPGCVCGVTFGTISTQKMHLFASQLPHDYSYFTVLRETEPMDHSRNGETPFQRQGLSSPSQEGSGGAFQSRSVCWWGTCKSRLKQQSPSRCTGELSDGLPLLMDLKC